MPRHSNLVFLLDVDNTLLDNDAVIADLRRHLTTEFGAASAERYWATFEALRKESGYADYLGALQRYRDDTEPQCGSEQNLLLMANYLLDYPFAERLYPHALDVLERLAKLGPTVILSDGDVVFQPHKVQRSGLWRAVNGRVLIFTHKEFMLEVVQRLYPARHYVMVDDKLRLLSAMKGIMQSTVTTVFVRQGHYALDLPSIDQFPPADVDIRRIGELLTLEASSYESQHATPAKHRSEPLAG